MTFKVGDKVRIIADGSMHGLNIGSTITIDDFFDDDQFYFRELIILYDDVEEIEKDTNEKKFTTDQLHEIIEETIEQIRTLSELKGSEYSGDDDRLANFRRNAKNLDLTMEDVWAVYCAKHYDAVMTYIKDLRTGKKRERLESISGRLDDIIVYSILMKAMVRERGN